MESEKRNIIHIQAGQVVGDMPNNVIPYSNQQVNIYEEASLQKSPIGEHLSKPSAHFVSKIIIAIEEPFMESIFSEEINGVHQLNESELMMIGEKSNYHINLDTKQIEATKSETYGVHNYFYYEKDDLHVYMAKYGYGHNFKLGVLKNDELIFQSGQNIAQNVSCGSNDVTGNRNNVIYFRSAGLIDAQVYGLSHSGDQLLMFDIDQLKENKNYKEVVINADTPLSDIVSDGSTIVCLNGRGALSRLDLYQQKHNITQRVELGGYSDEKRFYFTVGVKGSVVVVASGKEKQNTVELLDYQSLKAKSSLLIPKSNNTKSTGNDAYYHNKDNRCGALMKIKIIKKKLQSFIVGSAEHYHMYLMGVHNDRLLLIDQKEDYGTFVITYFDELIRSQINHDNIELIVTGIDELHHIVTIKINN